VPARASAVAIGLLIIGVAAGGSYVWISGAAGSAEASLSPSSSAPADAAATSPAAASASSSPAPVVAVAPAATLAAQFDPADMSALLEIVHEKVAANCVILTPADERVDPQAIAALQCRGAGNRVLYQSFESASTVDELYQAEFATAGLGSDTPGCWNATPGEVDYGSGRAACWTSATSGDRKVLWTYPEERVLGTAWTTSKSMRDLVTWWWFRARMTPDRPATRFTADEQRLVDRVPSWMADTCDPYDPLDDNSYDPIGTIASIDCVEPDSSMEGVGWFLFESPEALAAWYEYRLGEEGLTPGSGGCFDGTEGETSWEGGRIACYVSGKQARVRWIDDDALIYGAANSTSSEIGQIVEWLDWNGIP
jgi:hypothetical protein